MHILLCGMIGLCFACGSVPDQDAGEEHVCPPCGCGSDDQVFGEAGECPSCSMTLIKKSEIRTMNVAIAVWNGVELLDFAGPGEVFAAARAPKFHFNVYTVARSGEAVMSQGFVSLNPGYSIANCPPPDIIVIPGGGIGGLRQDEAMMGWIQKTAQSADMVLTVCTGAFAVAAHGLLDGLEATTHWGAIEALREGFPEVRVLTDRRFVDTGKFITSAGVSAGIDSSLHIVDRILGRAAAQRTARYMEYRWEPGPSRETRTESGGASTVPRTVTPVARIGEPAPDFQLESVDGETVRLSALRGRVVVLEWTNHQCPTVNHYHGKGIIRESRQRFRDEPLTWIAIDSSHFCGSARAEIQRWRQRRDHDYAYLLDPAGEVGRRYGAKTTPHLFVIDQQGRLAYAGAVDDRHGEVNYVVMAVQALLRGESPPHSRSTPRGCSVKYAPRSTEARPTRRPVVTDPSPVATGTGEEAPGPEATVFFDEAVVAASRDESERALQLLARSFTEGYREPSGVLTHPAFDRLRRNPETRVRVRELLREHARSARIQLTSRDERGDPLTVSGTVRTADGVPVPGALLYVYHTDARGNYSDEGDRNPRIFGYLRTDAAGRYEYRTIRPAAYPNTEIDQHVHYVVEAPGRPQETRRLGFADDPWWRDRPTAGAWVAPVETGPDGVAHCRADIVVGGNS